MRRWGAEGLGDCPGSCLTSVGQWSLAVSLLGSETLWRRTVGTDQDQNGVKPNMDAPGQPSPG